MSGRVGKFHEDLRVLLAVAMDLDAVLSRSRRRIPPDAVTDADMLTAALTVALLCQCRDRLEEIEKGGAW
jgi:hypothetical protein